MKEQAICKINKVGKISYIITMICKILMIIGLVCCVVASVLLFMLPSTAIKVTQSGAMHVEVSMEDLGGFVPVEDLEIESSGQRYVPITMDVTEDGMTIDLASEEFGFDLHEVAWFMVMISVVLLISVVTLSFIGSLCKAFRDCESPFEAQVIEKMQNLAICLIPWTIVSSIGDSVSSSMLSGGMEWSFSIDLGVVLVVMIVLILVYIFKYGAVLQQESDETL